MSASFKSAIARVRSVRGHGRSRPHRHADRPPRDRATPTSCMPRECECRTRRTDDREHRSRSRSRRSRTGVTSARGPPWQLATPRVLLFDRCLDERRVAAANISRNSELRARATRFPIRSGRERRLLKWQRDLCEARRPGGRRRWRSRIRPRVPPASGTGSLKSRSSIPRSRRIRPSRFSRMRSTATSARSLARTPTRTTRTGASRSITRTDRFCSPDTMMTTSTRARTATAGPTPDASRRELTALRARGLLSKA